MLSLGNPVNGADALGPVFGESSLVTLVSGAKATGSSSMPSPGWSEAASEGAQSLPLGSLNALDGCGDNLSFMLVASGRFVAEPA